MIFKVNSCRAIKELVIRFDVGLYELQGAREVQHSEYSIALDVQPYVNTETDDGGNMRLNINGDAIMQELTNSIVNLQLTAGVAQNMVGARWNVFNEEEKSAEAEIAEKLSD